MSFWTWVEQLFPLTHYEVLGVSRHAGAHEIEEAFHDPRRHRRRVTPERRLASYRTLIDPVQRTSYDRWVAAQESYWTQPPMS